MLCRRSAALALALLGVVLLGGCTATLANRRDLFSPPDEHPRIAAVDDAELARLRRGDAARPGTTTTTTTTVTTTTAVPAGAGR